MFSSLLQHQLLRTSILQDDAVAVALNASLSLMSQEMHRGKERDLQPLSKARACEKVMSLTFA
uniref:Uncharacterized protein n=1 Tax=Athene cunicularia TaxID=194338 RepID=A0A663N1Y4_ATHCN